MLVKSSIPQKVPSQNQWEIWADVTHNSWSVLCIRLAVSQPPVLGGITPLKNLLCTSVEAKDKNDQCFVLCTAAKKITHFLVEIYGEKKKDFPTTYEGNIFYLSTKQNMAVQIKMKLGW